uniref:Uncharacterized protein n=1 Tax=Anguilla anguilla TaxID=7936 RepID=A0A0E9WUR5_ANGAN
MLCSDNLLFVLADRAVRMCVSVYACVPHNVGVCCVCSVSALLSIPSLKTRPRFYNLNTEGISRFRRSSASGPGIPCSDLVQSTWRRSTVNLVSYLLLCICVCACACVRVCTSVYVCARKCPLVHFLFMV